MTHPLIIVLCSAIPYRYIPFYHRGDPLLLRLSKWTLGLLTVGSIGVRVVGRLRLTR